MIRVALLVSSNLLFFQPPCGEQPREEAALRSAVEQFESTASLLALADFLKDRGRYREAEPLYLRSKTINETLYGPSSLETAESLLRLGSIYHAELRLPEAEAAARMAVDLFQKLAGNESRAYALAAANLAVILADEDQPARAEPTLRRSLFLLEKHASGSPEASIAQAIIEQNLAIVHLRQHEVAQAEPLLADALGKFHTANDSSAALTLAALAEISIAHHRWAEADSRIREASRIVLDRQGHDHPWLIGILHLKSNIESHLGDWRQAAVDLKRALELLETAGGSRTLRTAIFLDDYALILRHLGRSSEAKAQRKRARDLRSELRLQ